MAATEGSGGWSLVDVPWGRATLVLQIVLFAIPATIAWTSTLDGTVWLPLVALPATFGLGLLLLLLRDWRRTGARVVGATLLAGVIEVGLAALLIVAYGSSHPGWDLS